MTQTKLTSIADLETEGGKAMLVETEFNIGRMFDEFLDAPEEERDGRAPGIHASELCTCLRQVVYTLYGTKKVKDNTPMMRKKFMVGHAVHSMLQSAFHTMVKKKGGAITFSDEVKVGDTELARKYDISSSCDGVFTVYAKKGEMLEPVMRIGLEIKTESPDQFSSLKEPRQKHIEQAHLYMACLDLPVMWFLYWNKGNENYTTMASPWLQTFDQKVWDKLKGRADKALDFASKEELPPREEGFHCTWCPYAHVCEPPNAPKGGGRFRNVIQHRPIRKGT